MCKLFSGRDTLLPLAQHSLTLYQSPGGRGLPAGAIAAKYPAIAQRQVRWYEEYCGKRDTGSFYFLEK